MCEFIKESVSDEDKWNSVKTELKKWVETTRKNLIDISYTNNSYLDIIKNNEKSYTLEAVFLLSLNRTDNANNAPTSKYILPDFTYLGEQGDSKVMDTYHTQLVNLTLTNRFENYDSFRIKNSITYFFRW